MRRSVFCLIVVLCIAVAGVSCTPKQSPAQADLRATDTAGRVPALVDAAERDDADTLGQLIHALSDDDPAVRLFGFQALRSRTGQTHGYRYYDPLDKRQAAIANWNAWLAQQQGIDAPTAADANP